MRRLWNALTSLRLTVICLAISIVVIFIGTVAQADEGLYEAQARYFKQWLVWGPMFLGYRLPVILPGGYLLGTILVLNLVAAHWKRFTWSVRKAGIHLAHLGIVVLLTGQLFTDMLSVETHLRLREGESRSFTEKHRTHELVLIEAGGENERSFSFPEPLVAQRGTIVHEALPFELRVKNYHANSDLFARAAVLEAAGQIRQALASVEAQFATNEGLVRQAEQARQNPGRLRTWRDAFAAIGETEVVELAAAVERLEGNRRERLRQELRTRFRDEMLAAFMEQGGAAQVAAERLMRGEVVTPQTLPLEADRGYGLEALVIPLPRTKELNTVNLPAAAVEFVAEGESLGTWLLSPWLDPQEIVAGEKTWRVAFRPQRVQHPFEVKLLTTTHEVYPGTDIPKNFQSRIHINHPVKGERREVDISMNNPLRYEGLTFFQYQMGRDEWDANRGTSTLLVVRNPGWLAPYLGCILVGLGLSYHFLLHLLGFVGRRRARPREASLGGAPGFAGRAEPVSPKGSEAPRRAGLLGLFSQWAPLPVALLVALWLLGGLRTSTPVEDEFAMREFGRLPIVANGRIQPMDSLARNALLQLRERQTLDLDSQRLSATEWIMAMMMNPDLANTWPVFRIDHPDLKGLLGGAVGADADEPADGRHFTWLAVRARLQELQAEARRAGNVEQARRTSYEQAVVRLWGGVAVYMRLQNTIHPQNARDWKHELESFAANAPDGIAAMLQRAAGEPYDAAAAERTERDLQRFDVMAQLDLPLIIPSPAANGAAEQEEWMSTVDALVHVARTASVPAGLEHYARMAGAYRAGDAAGFNDAVTLYRAALAADFQPEIRKASREHLFNRLAPFYKALVLYGLAFLCAVGFWIAPHRLDWLRRIAVSLVFVALVVHSAGLLFRMLLEGRPPVTNLYSSAIFVGWGACILGLVLERVWRNSMGIVVSSILGFLTLIVAHHLSLGGDTMEMVRAVLDTNFWLATHVVVITLGYSAMFVAGSLAALFILFAACTRSMDADTSRSMGRMVYGVICFATLFSFVGTLLGGIWADQSWGRFWGWDPKENGALIIVLWNALILHARWGGFIQERGLMNLAVLGNVVTAWSWFGVNMLGIGLHSYGFMDSGFRWLALFVGSQLLLVTIGIAPRKWWRGARSGVPV